ncbi:MAG: flagellar filament capping protein FliD [Phycisphaerales bacterium]|nr:flagellar filament capping protein FliD [Phycisphaerales bacterium]
MGTISSGVGLISGLDIQGLVDQLIAIDAQPRDQLVSRIGRLNAQRTAFLDISARIAGILSRAASLTSRSTFLGTTATSSLPTALTATAGASAAPGTYQFLVRSLASTHQVVSQGFAARDATLTPGELRIESALARVDRETRLDQLNGHTGVRGTGFRLIDASGAEATINIGDIDTLTQLTQRINDAGLNIRAEIRDERLSLTETTGGAIRVREIDGGTTAADLGFPPGTGFSASGALTGASLATLRDQTPLAALNDGLGIRRSDAGGDFTVNVNGGEAFRVDLSGLLTDDTRIEQLNSGGGANLGVVRIKRTNAAGIAENVEVDLRGLRTIGEIKNELQGATEGLNITLSSGRLLISDQDGRKLTIEDVQGTGARDLGIAGSADNGSISGRTIYKVETVGDALRAINYANGNTGQLTARIDGGRLVFDAAAGVSVTSGAGQVSLAQLGFQGGDLTVGANAGQRVLGGVDTTLLKTLNGGRGFDLGVIEITTDLGAATVDLSDAETLQEAIDRINDAAGDLGVEATVDPLGTKLAIAAVDANANVRISDVSGDFAEVLGLNGDASSRIVSNNLERQYIGTQTLLSDLNNGVGVNSGAFTITSSAGVRQTIDLRTSNIKTVGDLIDEVNRRNFGVTASLNDTGDGLKLVDSAGGTFDLKVEDADNSTTAADLNLLGTHASGVADGSFEIRVDIAAGDTLEDVVARINERGLATAGLINDGSANPYRLSITSRASGEAGALLVDGAALGVGFSTLSRAQDARVVVGGADGGIIVRNSSNTFNDIVPGISLNIESVSDDPITVTVGRDVDGMVENISGLVDAFNTAMDALATATGYNAETEQRGILLGDGSALNVENRLFRIFGGSIPGASGALRRWSDIGIRIRDGELQFDESKFRAAFENNPEAVADFFTAEEGGAGAYLKAQLETITGADGLLKRAEGTLESQTSGLNDRVDVLNDRLSRKRDRLLRQFQAMEQVLSGLQSQQNALAQLGSLTASTQSR